MPCSCYRRSITSHGKALNILIYLQREELMQKEVERLDRERKKEEERFMREKQREEERLQKEQWRENKRMEKFLVKQSMRVSPLASKL